MKGARAGAVVALLLMALQPAASQEYDLILRNGRIPIYDTPQQCALAMYGLTRYARLKNRP